MIPRSLCVAAVLWLCTAAAVSADDATPPPVSTPVPVTTDVIPTLQPVATDVPPTVAPVTEPSSVSVAPERNTPVATVENPGSAVPTARPETQPPGSRQIPIVPQPTSGSGASFPGTAGTPPDSTSGVPPDLTLPSGPQDSSSGLDLTTQSGAAQAPAQLTCSVRRHPVAGPFLSSPFSGWTELVSYVDHDRPDYSIDGKIVLSNGLTALASDGTESDLFPAYWSPDLRQFINYDGHNGYDFDISYQPVLAAAAGTVEYAGWNDPNPYVGYGQMVLINHHNGYVTLYGHLSKLEVATGDKVASGQEIGISGTTGHSSGPHLHFSVFHDCQVADPYGWTGHGRDPLADYSGSLSSYLWLPGHDPLVLNPPPAWPSYPVGLHVSVTGTPELPGFAPPTDRLLLLALPSPRSSAPVDSGTALARTESAVVAESQMLAPELAVLKAQGLVSAFQVIPAAAAIWVHGTASSQELEALPGVASLSGVQPHDVSAAQLGLAHAVLAQIGREQAPALWPVGFRSGLHAWRPVATVLSRDALVAGLALPGKEVNITLERGSRVAAIARTVADAATGGFAAMLEDQLGNAVGVRPGDDIRVTCDGRTTAILVQPGSVAARTTSIHGSTTAGATVALSEMSGHEVVRSWVSTANAHGHFVSPVPHSLPAGTQIVAGIKDAAGNEQATAEFVPGLDVVEGSDIVRGWTVSSAPRLQLQRAGHTLVNLALRPGHDGSFSLALGNISHPIALAPGDVLVMGSAHHHRSLSLPRLPDGASQRTAAGDILTRQSRPIGVVLHQGTPVITGVARPGEVVALEVELAGKLRGTATAVAAPESGRFRTFLHDFAGRPVRVGAGDQLLTAAGGQIHLVEVPRLRIFVDRKVAEATVISSVPASLILGTRAAAHWNYRQIRIDRSGKYVLPFAQQTGQLHAISVLWNSGSGVSVTRSASVP